MTGTSIGTKFPRSVPKTVFHAEIIIKKQALPPVNYNFDADIEESSLPTTYPAERPEGEEDDE